MPQIVPFSFKWAAFFTDLSILQPVINQRSALLIKKHIPCQN
ncbi:hypothetical protein Cabys_2216 [Caldithrix abyssi DSM 13497]|uniref:Uncharacterized protein n=1 Tax=Caldithrix abyssi DSM 13497 TaxID=880073 RepID=A0A1J1C8D9_CALAY|nr:hypothetical protein Cabys_2216 [Caldithrix abyssi DSM 13497]